jgi:CheY-like chemotaxis protein
VVELRDTGVGMDEETRRRCLEPFYTTKGERGTGLGLAMVFGMVKRHSAELEIDSVPGTGTAVRLIFPAPEVAPAVVRPPSSPLQLRRLRVLIVDDDPLLIKSLRDILEADGHQVTAAEGGQVAIETFVTEQHRGEPFAAVITDLGMPYVDGRRVAATVRAASPTVAIILLTGWGQRLLDDNDIPAGVDRVLAKPPKLHELRTAFAELIGRERTQLE